MEFEHDPVKVVMRICEPMGISPLAAACTVLNMLRIEHVSRSVPLTSPNIIPAPQIPSKLSLVHEEIKSHLWGAKQNAANESNPKAKAHWEYQVKMFEALFLITKELMNSAENSGIKGGIMIDEFFNKQKKPPESPEGPTQ